MGGGGGREREREREKERERERKREGERKRERERERARKNVNGEIKGVRFGEIDRGKLTVSNKAALLNRALGTHKRCGRNAKYITRHVIIEVTSMYMPMAALQAQIFL